MKKAIDDRRERARSLKAQGYTWAQIGALFGVTRQRAQKIGEVKK